MIRRIYQAAAEGCAEVVTRMPSLEEPFVRFGAHAWSRPIIGRFYRSAVDRVATRLRRGGKPFRTLIVCGVPLILDVTEFTTKTLYFGRVPYEPQTADCLVRSLMPGSVFVDVGANHGYFSLLAAALVGSSGRVVAFEPNPQVFGQLRTHVMLNGFESRVTTIDAALADVSDAEARLFVSHLTTNSGLSSLNPRASTLDRGWLTADHTVPVRVETFDRWLATSGLPRVDLVKIDVEGAEHRVIAGMAQSLAQRRIGAILCETEWDGATHRALCHDGFTPTLLDPLDDCANVLYSRP
jgi:FkbM family methyltransferase